MSKKSTTKSSQIDSRIELVQAIPGCIQLRASDASSRLMLNTLAQQLVHQEGVYTVQTDPATGNLIIIFDPRLIPLPSAIAILQQWGIGGVSTPIMPTNMQMGTFLYEHPNVDALLPMIAGMIVVETFKLKGGWGMLINLAAAVLTRQVLDQEEQALISTTTVAVSSEPIPDPIVESPDLSDNLIQIVHAVPGRVRLRVPQVEKSDYANRVRERLSAIDFVTSVRINPDAASIAITYRATEVSDAAICDRLIALLSAGSDNVQPEPVQPETIRQPAPNPV